MYPAPGPPRLQVQRDARDQATAADGDEHRVEVRQLLQQLDRDGALAGDHVAVLEGVDERGAALRLGLHRLQEGFVVAAPRRNHPCAQALDGLHLQLVGVLWHVDRRRDLEDRGRVSDALAVIAGAGGDHPGGALPGQHTHQLVEGAPHLEGAGRLDSLDLDVDVAAGLGGESARVLQRRGCQVRTEVGGRLLDGLRPHRDRFQVLQVKTIIGTTG